MLPMLPVNFTGRLTYREFERHQRECSKRIRHRDSDAARGHIVGEEGRTSWKVMEPDGRFGLSDQV